MKIMSAAFKKAQDYRDAINSGRAKLIAKDLSSVVYLYTNIVGQLCAVGYRGRAKKPAFNFRYKSYNFRAKQITEWMQTQSERHNVRRKTDERQLQVDDVLSASWGYEQTNIDYYKVTKLIGKTMVELVEIGGKRLETMAMQGKSIPDPDTIIGEPMRRKADGEHVKVDSVRYARKKYPEIVAGARVYNSDHWTAYH